jgi:hypothetical protein
MSKINRKGFFSTLFGGLAGIVAGTSVKASEPTPVVEKVLTCDKLVFTHSSASCVMSFVDSDNFRITVNNNQAVYVNIHSPLKQPEPVTSNLTDWKFSSNGNVGLGTAYPTTRLYING